LQTYGADELIAEIKRRARRYSLIKCKEIRFQKRPGYLTPLQRHAAELARNPSPWMPWQRLVNEVDASKDGLLVQQDPRTFFYPPVAIDEMTDWRIQPIDSNERC